MKLDAEDLMEDRKLNVNKPKEPNNKALLGIVIAIIVTIAIICILLVMMQQLKPAGEGLKVYVNGKEASINSSTFLFENSKLYVSVKGIAKHVGYEAHSGEYKIEAEDPNKVFVENKEETASMFLNSSVISKTTPNMNDEYRNYEMSEPARAINGDIYVISDGIETACNIKIIYNANENKIDIVTLDYYYDTYNKAVQKIGFAELSNNFENKKAILYDRLVVKNADGDYGVINSKNEEIIGTRYANIQFDEYNQEFTITNSYGKVGIDYINGETKINVKYDEIKSIDKKDGLYLIKNNNKYGVIDNTEKIIIHTEYDEIGVDITPFYTTTVSNSATQNENLSNNETSENEDTNIMKEYVFYEKLIPVKQNDMWGFFDVQGNKISELKYTGIGCMVEEEEINSNKNNNNAISITNKKTTGNLLLIDEYELIVVENNKKYGLIDVNAKEILPLAATDMYSITNAGVKSYYMQLNGNIYNIETDFLERLGIKKKTDDAEEMESTENNTTINNTTIENQ